MFIVYLLMVVLLMFVLFYTGTLNKLAEITGYATSANTALNISISNTAPTIGTVNVIAAQDPTDDTTTSITFNYTVTDNDGAGNINLSEAKAYFNKTGETTRSNTTCINTSIGVGNNINFTCTISMYYFDVNGAWTINATIKDKSASYVENSTTTFTYNILTAMKMAPTSLSWASIGVTTTDAGSSNDPIIINNTGNDIPLDVNVTSYNLRGETTITEFIYGANFTVQNASQGCSGTAMVNATSTNITTSTLQRGNHSLGYNNATSGQEEIFFCLKGVLSTLSQQSYSSSAYGSWLVAVIT